MPFSDSIPYFNPMTDFIISILYVENIDLSEKKLKAYKIKLG